MACAKALGWEGVLEGLSVMRREHEEGEEAVARDHGSSWALASKARFTEGSTSNMEGFYIRG